MMENAVTVSWDVVGTFEEMAQIALEGVQVAADENQSPDFAVYGRGLAETYLRVIAPNGDNWWNTVGKLVLAAVRQALEAQITLPTFVVFPEGTATAVRWHWLRTMTRRAQRLDTGDMVHLRETLIACRDIAYLLALKANADKGVAEVPLTANPVPA